MLFGNYGKWKQYGLSEVFFGHLIDSIKKQNLKGIKKNYYGYLYKKIFYHYFIFVINFHKAI